MSNTWEELISEVTTSPNYCVWESGVGNVEEPHLKYGAIFKHCLIVVKGKVGDLQGGMRNFSPAESFTSLIGTLSEPALQNVVGCTTIIRSHSAFKAPCSSLLCEMRAQQSPPDDTSSLAQP